MHESQTASSAHPPSPEQDATTARQPTLLFVDDDTLIRELMVEGLRHKGYNVIQAEDGAAALACLATGQTIDLMITDYSMPEMTGIELISHVHPAHPALPLFLLTGYADEHVAQTLASLTAGKGVLLRKPIRLPDLVAHITAAIAR